MTSYTWTCPDCKETLHSNVEPQIGMYMHPSYDRVAEPEDVDDFWNEWHEQIANHQCEMDTEEYGGE